MGQFALDTYTLADLERITGAKRRSLQLWADAGVLQAEQGTNRAGTGRHRQFSRNEAMLACIIHGFARRQVAIGELLKIAHEIREALSHDHIMKPILESIIRREANWMLVWETWVDGPADAFSEPSDRFLFPGKLGAFQEALATRAVTQILKTFRIIKPESALTFSPITWNTNEDGGYTVWAPLKHFERPEAVSVVIQLGTYLQNMD